MKIPIIISAIILAVAAGLGWRIQQRLTAARMDESGLVVEVKRIGISSGDVQPARSVRRVRADLDAEARQLAIEYNTEAKKWESGPIIGVDE